MGMDALVMSKIFGPFFIVIGLWMFLRYDEVQKLWNAIKTNPPFMHLGAILNLLIGFTLIATCGFSFGMPLLLSLIGILAVVRGVLVFFMPKKVVEFTDSVVAMGKPLSYIPLALGVIITLYALFA